MIIGSWQMFGTRPLLVFDSTPRTLFANALFYEENVEILSQCRVHHFFFNNNELRMIEMKYVLNTLSWRQPVKTFNGSSPCFYNNILSFFSHRNHSNLQMERVSFRTKVLSRHLLNQSQHPQSFLQPSTCFHIEV